MTEQEFLKLLHSHEWNDIEFKEAQTAVPKNAYETVSTFANTAGGHLVFGVKKDGTNFEVVGVLGVDKVQNDFLTTIRQQEKLNMIVEIKEHLHSVDKKYLLVFYVPEVSRSENVPWVN